MSHPADPTPGDPTPAADPVTHAQHGYIGAKDDYLKRLRRIEGQVRGIHKMVEEDTYCVDILKQTYAVQRAIEKFEQLLVRDHLRSCVPDGIREGRDEAVLSELAELFTLSRR